MSENGPGKIKRDKARTIGKPYSSEKSLIGRVKDRVKNMFSSSIWGQGQDILKPSFLGALNTNSQGSSDSVERKSDDRIVSGDSIPTASEISLPLKSNNVLSMASVSSQPQNITATPIFPREGVSVFPRKLNSISPLDNLRAVDNNKRSFDPQPTVQLTKPQFNSSLFSEGAGKQAELVPKSPFYPGNTTFGGASSIIGSYYPAPYSKTPIRRKVQAKHMSSVVKNNSKSLVTSSTAKRILETLENMSSPVTNAKKIPVYNDPGSLTFTPAAYSRRARSRYSLDNGPPVSSRISSKLNTTTDGTLSADNMNDISLTSNKILASENTILTTKPFSMDESALRNMDQRETIVQEPPSNSLKMKTKLSAHAHYSAKPADSNPDYSLSTAVTLDIKALPKFDFMTSTASETEQQAKRKQDKSSDIDTDSKKPKMLPEVCEQKPKPSFESIFKDCQKSTITKKPSLIPEPSTKEDSNKFSFAPGVKPSNSLSNAVDVSLKDVGDFHFNRGISPIRASLSSSIRIRSVAKRKNDDINEKSTYNSDSFSKSSNIKSPFITSIENIVSEVPPKSLSSPSVLPSKKSESSVESAEPLSVLTDKTQTKSINFGSKESTNIEKSSLDKKDSETTCSTSKFSNDSKTSNTEAVPLSALFKKKDNTWNCSVCMVNNQDDLLNCASCSEPKPGTSKESSGFNPNTSIKFSSFLQSDDKKASKTNEKTSTPSIVVNQAGGFKIAPFKPEEKKEKVVEESSEEKSKEEKPKEDKPAETTTSTSLSALFKKTDVWRCPSCDIENKNDITSCLCCGDSKPGTKNTDSTLKSDSGLKFSFLESSKTDKLNAPTKSASTVILNETGGFKFSTSLPSLDPLPETSKKSEAPASNTLSTTAFGESSTKKSSSPFVFGQTSTTTATPSTFVFGQQSSKPSESSGIAFGQPITSVSTSAFGQPSATTTSSPVPFLQSPISTASSTNFQFNVGGLKSTSSSNPALASISAASSAPKVTSTFSFGKPPSTSTSESEIIGGNKVDLFQFTGSGDSSTKTTTGFTFGKSSATVNSSNTAKSEPFQFNVSATNTLSSGPSFTPPTFGTPKTGGFDSSKSTTASAPASASFTFGQTTSFGTDTNKFGGFNKAAATTTAPSSNFTFGSPSTSASTFGGTNNLPTNQFNFGAQQPLNQNNGGAGIFQFSAQTNNVNGVQQPSAPSNNQGFNFQAAPATPSFNFGQQPPQNTSNFQFSGSAPPPSNNMNNVTSTLNPFSASPSVPGKRQIKKATRKLRK